MTDILRKILVIEAVMNRIARGAAKEPAPITPPESTKVVTDMLFTTLQDKEDFVSLLLSRAQFYERMLDQYLAPYLKGLRESVYNYELCYSVLSAHNLTWFKKAPFSIEGKIQVAQLLLSLSEEFCKAHPSVDFIKSIANNEFNTIYSISALDQ